MFGLDGMRTATNSPKEAETQGRTWDMKVKRPAEGWVGVSRAGSLGFAVSPVETAQQGGLGGVRASRL